MSLPRQLDLVDAIHEADRVPTLTPWELQALEFMQHELRAARNPSCVTVGEHLGFDTAFGAGVIEGLISKGYLMRQYTVLRPSVREVCVPHTAEVGGKFVTRMEVVR